MKLYTKNLTQILSKKAFNVFLLIKQKLNLT